MTSKRYKEKKNMATSVDNVPTLFTFAMGEAHVMEPSVFPDRMIQATPPDILMRAPVRPVVNGSTDYLDLVEKKEFTDTNVIRGQDQFRRPFVAFHVEVIETKETGVFVMFKRYTPLDDTKVVCVKSHAGGGGLEFREAVEYALRLCTVVDDQSAAQIFALLSGNVVTTPDGNNSIRLVPVAAA